MRTYLRFLRLRGKMLFDRIGNEQIKRNILQAVPFWIGSVLTGLAAVVYAKLFAWSEALLQWIVEYNALLLFVFTPVAFVLSWWLVDRYAPYAKGSGIPQVMASIELATPRERFKIKQLLNLKIIGIKVLSSMVLVSGGGAVGREGPTIQIAGSIFRFVHRMLPRWWPRISIQNMIMTGAAAGLAAAFNTPLGGIVFAVEELARVHFNYFKTALFTAVIVAGLTAQTLAGSYLFLGYPNTHGVTMGMVVPVLAVAIICGLLSSYLSAAMLRISRFRSRLRKSSHQILFLILTALIIASLAYFVNYEILGSGKSLMERLLFSENKSEPWYMPLFRMVGPALSFTSGGAGGIFAPALSAGASFGAFFAGIFQYSAEQTNVLILAGMVAFLTGITRAPFTSAIIVLEMTDRHSLIFFLMMASMVASLSAFVLRRKGLYESLKNNYLHELGKLRKRKAP